MRFKRIALDILTMIAYMVVILGASLAFAIALDNSRQINSAAEENSKGIRALICINQLHPNQRAIGNVLNCLRDAGLDVDRYVNLDAIPDQRHG